MKTLTVTQMNRNPSSPLRLAENGETVIITSHGKPIARITGIAEHEWEQTLSALAASPAVASPKSHFVVPPFFDEKSRQPYNNEKLQLPLHLNWSHKDLAFDMSKPNTRARLYEKVLAEGSIQDLQKYINFDDLKNLWSALYLAKELRKAWESMYPTLKE